jgi:hypothetical protein
MLAVVRDRAVVRPQAADELHPLLEDRLVVLERDLEGPMLAPVIAAARGEIDAPAAHKVEGRPLLGDTDRVMQWQNSDGGSQPDATRPRRDIGEHQIRAGKHAQGAKVMLADPRRMQTNLLGRHRLVDDVGDEVVRAPGVVVVVVVAQGENSRIALALSLRGASPSFKSVPCEGR